MTGGYTEDGYCGPKAHYPEPTMLFRDRAWCAAHVRYRKRRLLPGRLDALSGPSLT